jgi:heparin/heparan-sulfate lyase
MGQVYTRSSWTDRDATWAAFQCGALFAGHQHLDNNGFAIFKRASLAIDSGVNEYSSHRANYYSRSIAHNTVLVFDKAEQFPSAVWSSRGTGGSNDGGQRRVGYPTRVTASAAGKKVREVGRIAAFVNVPEFCYAAGDASKSYSPKKLRSFYRQFLHLRPDTFVIFDRVTATRADLPKAWLLHSISEPRTAKLPGGATFAVEHGGARLLGWTLLPAGAKLSKVGGPGREYWVNGRNYPPDKKKDPEAGAWRLEISPPKPAAGDFFLHVLHASAGDGARAPAVKLVRTGAEVEVEIADGARKTSVVFAASGAPAGRVTMTSAGRKTIEKRFPAGLVVPQREKHWGRAGGDSR